MRRLLKAAALAVPLVLMAGSVWADVPPPAAGQAAPALRLVQVTGADLTSRTLLDEIFQADQPGTLKISGVGRCSQSCQLCILGSPCPPDDDGTPQFCMPYCP
jgi:hypothetical protein